MKRLIKNFIKKFKFIFNLLLKLNNHISRKKAFRESKALCIKTFEAYHFKKNEKKVFLFGSPNHTNLGDQAQTYCTINWFQKNYPAHRVYDFSAPVLNKCNYLFLRRLKKFISSCDRLFIQSGYNTTDLYIREENLHRAVLKIFKNHTVIILPQTVFFTQKVESEKTKRIYNAHPKLIFFARDRISYETAKELLPEKRVYLYPDIVTSLIGKYTFSNERNGIMLCMRNDKEALYSKDEIKKVALELSDFGNVDFSDTTINDSYEEIVQSREKYLFKTFGQYSKYKLIITDRYHGTIFSLISGTPVIVVNSTDHKLSSGVAWFDECSAFKNYVYTCNSLDEIYKTVEKIIRKDLSHILPDYFDKEYYTKLFNLIESK